MKIVKILISYSILIGFIKFGLFSFEIENHKININKNEIEDKISILYKHYMVNNEIVNIDLLKENGFLEEFYQLLEYKIFIDNQLKSVFKLKAIKYLQSGYINGYNYEIKEIQDNGFMIEINTNTQLKYNIIFNYKNNIYIKYILISNVFQNNYKICGLDLNIQIDNNILDVDEINIKNKFCYIDNELININKNNLTQYNNIAYYLQQANTNEEAIFLLEKIIEKYPNRIVAYLNLADAYLGINDIEKAKQNYEKYIELMKQDNKEEKIPKRVLEFLKN